MKITENIARIGNFTSSQIFRLMGTAAVSKTYIEERNLERQLCRSLENEAYSPDMAWGLFLEQRVLDLLGMEYCLSSDQTETHPEIEYWSGSKDLIVIGSKISEIKCFQPKNFAKYTNALLTKDLTLIKKEFPKEYYQLVSNAIINNVPNAEAITYMPYESELEDIREMASNYDGADQWKYRFISERDKSGLAHLPDGGYFKNLNLFEFEVPKEDKEALTERVLEAGKLLNPFFKQTI
jgi:hypothetical protein